MDAIELVFHFWQSGSIGSGPNFYYSENRGEFSARLIKLFQSLADAQVDESLSSIIVATAGEIGNNSFDHNSGYWTDRPGNSLGWLAHDHFLSIAISDRGRGVPRSLLQVLPANVPKELALKTAFETVISGRQPEKRGNGLKFVKKSIESRPGSSLMCLSGGQTYRIQGAGAVTIDEGNSEGTLTVIRWKLT